MNPELIRELEAQMGVVVRRVRRVMAERAAAIDPSIGAVGYGVMEHLATQGPCRQTDLVTALSSEKGAVSRAVQQLVELGLVEREGDPSDGRAHTVRLSEEGERRLKALAKQRRRIYMDKLADWSPEELEQFVRALARYNRSIEG